MTRAVLLTSGAVHRVAIGPDGADMTACGLPYSSRWSTVTPVQALVYPLTACAADCWPDSRWQHFVDGSTP